MNVSFATLEVIVKVVTEHVDKVYCIVPGFSKIEVTDVNKNKVGDLELLHGILRYVFTKTQEHKVEIVERRACEIRV